MSDPFANLLSSFKDGNPSRKTASTSTSTNNDNISNDNLNRLPSVPVELVQSADLDTNTDIHDDLDDLFRIPSSATNDNYTVNSNVGTSANDDNFMKAFDEFDSTTNNANGVVANQDIHNDKIFDEIRDMELSQLMSLGMPIEKANRYYDKGILYDDIIRKRREKLQNQKQQENDRVGTTYFDENNTNNKNASSSLFSMATNFLNKGKDLVDQLIAYPEEESDRLNQYRTSEHSIVTKDKNQYTASVNTRLSKNDQEEYNPFDINEQESKILHSKSPIPPLKSTTNTSNTVSNNDIVEGDLLGDLNEKINITQENSVTPSLQQQEELEESILLDFSGASSNSNKSTTDINTTIPRIQISAIELSGYNEFNINARELFIKGDYNLAFQEYEKSLNTLPQSHPLKIIALSNLMISQIKIGDYSKCVENSMTALDLFPNDKSQWSDVIQDSNPGKSYKEIWSKIVLRQAEAYEHLENFKNALDSYELLLINGYHDPKMLSAKRRCQKVLNPEIETPRPTVRVKTPQSEQSNAKPVSTSKVSQKISGAVEKIEQSNNREQEIEKQKLALYDIVYEKVEAWKTNKENDLRFLLSNLSTILTWSEWRPVAAADLVIPKKVKITYLKAIAKLHPDKLPDSLKLEDRMIAENVFSVLSTAWDKFKDENNMS